MATVLKTVVAQVTVGSNPTPSAQVKVFTNEFFLLGRCQSGRLGLPAKQLGGVELPPGFESLPPRCVMADQAPVAQWIERLVADQKVSGSSPDRGTQEG